MATPYPTLSNQKYISDPNQKIQWIFSDYLKAKHSQSVLFFGEMNSAIHDEYLGEYEGMKTAEIIQKSLTRAYSGYFDTVNFDVRDNTPENSKVVQILVKGVLTQDGKTYKLNENLQVKNGRLISPSTK